ncbi:MAG TPA: hypothetical protein PLH94_01860 [Fimbriimonadaceae bacterium]|nr:hypothetical protein [Fimbriimonadaceae bacterium]
MASANERDMSNRSLEFTALPLIEVALKRVPRTHIPISLPFVLDLQRELRGRFDQILDLDAVEQPPGALLPAAYAFHATCGCRLIDTSSGLSVNLQPDMLIVRWAATEGKEYPRFPALQRAADDVVAAINKIGLQPFEPVLVNLAYANRLEASIEQNRLQPSPWPLSDDWTPRGVREEGQAIEFQSVSRIVEGIDRRVLVQVRQEAPETNPWYLMLTVAGKVVSEEESAEESESQVHNALTDWFPRLLSEEAKRAYGLQS